MTAIFNFYTIYSMQTKTTAEIKKFGYEVGEGYVLLTKEDKRYGKDWAEIPYSVHGTDYL